MGKIVVPQTVNHLEGIIFREGILKRSFHIDGTERHFSYYVPANLKKDAKIIFLAHGSYCNGDIMRKATAYSFEEAAETENMIVVYPDSFGPYWNDGRLGRVHIARETGVDEEKFFRRIIHYMSSVYRTSNKDIFFGGFSNGGALGFRLSQTDLFKGIALWCINLPSEDNREYEVGGEVPTIIINNTEDRMVPFGGGDLIGSDGKSRGRFDSTYESFLKVSKADALPEPSMEAGYKRYLLNKNILLEIYKGGHVIPHPNTSWPAGLGSGSTVDSVKIILDYFRGL